MVWKNCVRYLKGFNTVIGRKPPPKLRRSRWRKPPLQSPSSLPLDICRTCTTYRTRVNLILVIKLGDAVLELVFTSFTSSGLVCLNNQLQFEWLLILQPYLILIICLFMLFIPKASIVD